MIQEQTPQQQQYAQPIQEVLYEQVQFINTSDQPFCITGLQALNYTNSSTIPISIQQQPTYQQTQPQPRNLNQKRIILITSPNTTVLRANNLNQAKKLQQYQTITTAPQKQTQTTRVISAPFLPKWPSTTPIVKSSPIKKIQSIKNAHQETHSSIQNHLKKKISTPSTATISIDIDSKSYCNQICKQQYKQTKKPTLATMAGIHLTGSMMEEESTSLSPVSAEMSGAMQNAFAATVEEINVPVFIDEYLQNTTRPKTTNSFNNDNIKCNPEGLAADIENRNGNINGNKANCIDESNIFENFEFDIDLITTEEYGASLSTAAAATATTSVQQQQQQKLQQETEMYNNMNVYNNNINSNNDINLSNFCNNNDYDFEAFLDDIGVKSEFIKHEVEEFEDQNSSTMQAQYHLLPQPSSEDIFITDDTLDTNSEMGFFELTENAIDLNNANVELSEILISSQNDPTLSSCCLSAANSQSLITDDLNRAIAAAEPIVPELPADVINAENTLLDVIKMEVVDCIEDDECDGGSGVNYFRSESGATKRSATITNNRSRQMMMREKRRKLHLDTSSFLTTSNNGSNNTLNTPGVIELIDKMGSDNKQYIMNFNKNTQEIVTDLLSVSNSSFNESIPHTPFTFASFDENEDGDENDESPSTPQSCFSTSYTNHIITSPNSPALSTISNTTRAHSNTKSKRGRPPKTHSDKPDLSKLRHLSESERKRIEDRAKNNEASRISRLKNKKREEQEIEEEYCLQEENIKLNHIHSQLRKQEAKLKRALHSFVQRQRQ